jgi:hypothetical protein
MQSREAMDKMIMDDLPTLFAQLPVRCGLWEDHE